MLTSINKTDSYPKMFSIEAPYCCGTISIEKDSSYTEQMLAEMPNITFSVYTLQDDEYVLYQPRALTIAIPADNKPVSFAIIDIPTSCIFSLVPNFDNNAFISHNKTVDIFGGDKWTTPTSEFPLTITWDNTNIVADSEGSTPVDTYTKEEIDQMLSDKVSEEQLGTHFVAGSNIEIVDNQDGTQTINASGEISVEDSVARAGVAALQEQMQTKPNIYSNTTSYWNSQATLVSEENAIYVYTDYDTDITTHQNIAAIKIGDGVTVVKDIPFSATAPFVDDVTVDGISVVDSDTKIADLETTGTIAGTGANAPYNASTNPVATQAYVDSAVEALDVTGDASVSATKTIASWSETDGKVAITTQDISIPVSQVNNVTATSTVYGVANASGKIVTGLDVAIPSDTAPSGAIVPVAYDSATETLSLKYITVSDVTPTSTSNVVCKTSS